MTSCFVYKDRINTQNIYQFTLTQVECTRYFLLHNYKQNMISLSLVADTTVASAQHMIIVFFVFLNEIAILNEIEIKF